jgi:hypothetical protein
MMTCPDRLPNLNITPSPRLKKLNLKQNRRMERQNYKILGKTSAQSILNSIRKFLEYDNSKRKRPVSNNILVNKHFE